MDTSHFESVFRFAVDVDGNGNALSQAGFQEWSGKSQGEPVHVQGLSNKLLGVEGSPHWMLAVQFGE